MRHTRPRRTEPASGPDAARRAPGVVAALAAGVVLVASVVMGTVAAGPATAATSCSGPLAAGQIRVVIVVDPGETGPRGPLATCLVVAAGTSGSKILAQRAGELGLPAPRYAGSGLLCGLDGFPQTACPVNNGGTYAYWAYFNGAGGSWSYGYDNPFVRRMVDGEIMGWRYTTGSPDGSAPQPRLAPSASLFPPLAAPTTAAPPSGGGSGPGPAGSSGGGGAPPGAAPPLPDISGLATTTTAAAGGPSETAADGEGATAEASADATASSGTDAEADVGAEELAAEPVGSSSASPTRWIGPAVAVAAAGALAGGAVVRSRRRTRVGA